MQPNALALGKEKRESSYRVTTKKENSEKVSFRSSTILRHITSPQKAVLQRSCGSTLKVKTTFR